MDKRRKHTQESIIKRFRERHGDKYDYSKVLFETIKSKLHITCRVCNNDFFPNADNHLRGSGCPVCAKNVRYTTKQAIKKFKKVHGDNYGYSKVKYINSREKVTILCKKCGNEFLQMPDKHWNGRGCPSFCYASMRDTQETVIEKFKKKHRDLFDYSKVKYVTSKTPVTIGCKECGKDFEMKPRSHTYGAGCPICASFKSERLFGKVLRDLGFHPVKVRPKWLKNPKTKKPLEIDHYLQRYKVGFEVNGIQHYEPHKLWGNEERFALTKERDQLKRDLCKQNGVRLIEYDLRNGRDYETMEKFILEHLKEEYDHTKTIWAKVETQGMDIFDFFELF